MWGGRLLGDWEGDRDKGDSGEIGRMMTNHPCTAIYSQNSKCKMVFQNGNILDHNMEITNNLLTITDDNVHMEVDVSYSNYQTTSRCRTCNLVHLISPRKATSSGCIQGCQLW